MKRFDIAIIGCGGICPMHLDGYADHPDRIHLAATCDILPDRAERMKEVYGAAQAFASVEATIDGADWDVAVVCTPTPVREEIIQPLAAAGKHVFVEKPMADSYAEARRMVEACEAAGVKLAVNQTFRYHYGFDIARGIIAEGRLGQVLTVTHGNRMFRQDVGWRVECPRHAVAVMGVHWLDGFRWLLGCEATTIDSRMYSSPAVDCVGETEATAQIVFECGAAVSYTQSFSCPGGHTETLVVGERGVLMITYEAVALFDKDHRDEPLQRWENPYAGQAKPKTAFKLLGELLTAIEQRGEPLNGGRDNLKTVSLLEGVYRSAEHGRPISLRSGLIE